MEMKGRAYANLRARGAPVAGVRPWGVLFLVPSERREHRLMRAAWEAELALGLFFFAKITDLSDRTVLTSAPWRTLRLTSNGEQVRPVEESPFETLAREAKALLSAQPSARSLSQPHEITRDHRGYTS
jgi:hypothetical protein